jgi:hypothetical protein
VPGAGADVPIQAPGGLVADPDDPVLAALAADRHLPQYFDPSAPPLTASDAGWAIEKAKEALAGVKALLAASPPERFG